MASFPANPEAERPPEKPSDNSPRPREAARQLDDVRGKVDRHELADPQKLHEEGYGSTSKSGSARTSEKTWAKSGDGEQTLDLTPEIYGDRQAKSVIAKTGADAKGPLGLLDKTTGEKLPSFAEMNSFNNKDYAAAFWDTDFVKNLSNQADLALTKLRGDQGPIQPAAGKIEESRDKLIGAHKPGETWSANGSEYLLDKNKDLIYKDKAGVHYRGADGLKFDGNGKESVLEKNGETVIKRGDQYLKKYANGEELEIKDKGEIEAVLKLENMVIEQRKSAIHKLDRQGMDQAAHEHSKVITGTDGVAVFRKDKENGTLVAKSSKEDGASIRLKNGELYKAQGGKLSKVHADGSESPVDDSAMPPEIKRGENGSLQIGTVNLSKDNKLTDTENDVLMHNLQAKVTAKTEKGPLTAEVVDGISSVKTAEHNFVYDSNNGKYTVLNPNNTVDLTYDNATKTLVTDGVTYTPSGTQIGNTFVNNDGGYAARKATLDNEKRNESSQEKEAAKHAERKAESELAEVAADISNYSATDADVSKLQGDLAMLQSLKGGDELSAQAIAHISAEQAAIEAALPRAEKQAKAADEAAGRLGATNPELTKIMVTDGGLTTSDLQRFGVLPLELYDSSQAA